MIESHRLEYKQQLTESFEKEVVAFLNASSGGVLYIGIDKDGKVLGVGDPDRTQLIIKDRLKCNIAPSCLGLFDIQLEEMNACFVVKVTIASGREKPYYLKKYGMSPKGAFLRVGSASEPMNVSLIETLFAQRTRHSLSKIKANRQDLHFEQLKIYYQEVGATLNQHFAANLELLTEGGQYNYVAYLLADDNNVSIKVAKYAGIDRVDLVESNEYGYCSLIKATKQVLQKLALENATQTTITSTARIERPLWEPIAIREAVINAIVHNDYTNEVPPKFEIFSDRVEITSAGRLPSGLSQAEFFEGFSHPVNRELMRIYKDLDMVEHLGSGVPRILKFYPKTSFDFTDHFIRMTFYGDQTEGGSIGGSIGGSMPLTVRQQEIMAVIKTDPSISYRRLATMLEINESAVKKHLNSLKEKGALVRVGGTRGYWEIKGDQ